MTLDELISELSKRDPARVVKHGFEGGHSDRGDYQNAAFTPVEETTIGAMLECAKVLLGSSQKGYKGGTYTMHGWVTVRIGEWGTCGEEITTAHLHLWDGEQAQDDLLAEIDREKGHRPMANKIQQQWMAPAYPNNPDHRAHEYGCEGMPTLLLVAAMLMQPKRDGNERTHKDTERRAKYAIADACALMAALDNRLAEEHAAQEGEG